MKKIFTFFTLISLFFLLLPQTAHSQSATLRGFVYESETGEPIIFTNVYLYKTSYGAATDVNGYFSITKVPPGAYTLMVTYLGYDTLRMKVELKPGELLTKNLYIKKSSVLLDVVNISAEREAARTETRTSKVKVTPLEIKQIPSVGGQPDIAQYLQVLPGNGLPGSQKTQAISTVNSSPVRSRFMGA